MSLDFVYNGARNKFATGQWNWPSLAVNAALVTAGYSPTPGNATMADVPSDAALVRDLALTGLAVSAAGICSGVVPLTAPLLDARPVVAVLFYVKGGSDATSPLIYYSSGGVGMPFLPLGFKYQIAFDQVAGGFFQV